MSPERAQREADHGDAHNDLPNVTQLQWDAVDAFNAALNAWSAWRVAVIGRLPEVDKLAAKLEYSADYVRLRKMRPPMPTSNIVQIVPAGYSSNVPYWGRD